ncbi:uncharacterized protein V1510DRAFT_415766 [Dipodascopsis tothii]|uniref:uncharacterized protein n=1 Tax=Dipodascopsis tothii TaxID=44089 RepID=UPI0034CD9A78
MDKERLIFAPSTKQYTRATLSRLALNPDPVEQFHGWFDEAKTQNVSLYESCTLSTAQLPSGRVSSRVVLFKELDKKGFIIYSNWGTSKKSKDIKSNPHAALNFFWRELERQVRIEGRTEFVTPEESQAYFSTRPRDSQIGAWSSPQSSVLGSREELDGLVEASAEKFKDVETIPCPPFWGGLRVIPYEIEFWQGRPSRVHDRFTYTRESEDAAWTLSRIAP